MDDDPQPADHDTNAERNSAPGIRFTIRTAAALIAVFAFVVLIGRWFVDLGVPPGELLAILFPGACGTFVGIAALRKWDGSTVLGGLVGGALGVGWELFTGMGLSRIIQSPTTLLLLGICGGGIVGALFGIVSDGFTLRRRSGPRW